MSLAQRKAHRVTHPQKNPGKIREKGLPLDKVVVFLKYQEGTAAGELPCLDTRANKKPLCFLQNIDPFSDELHSYSHNNLNHRDTRFAARSHFTENFSPQSGQSSSNGPRQEALCGVFLFLSLPWGRKRLEILLAWWWKIFLEAELAKPFFFFP